MRIKHTVLENRLKLIYTLTSDYIDLHITLEN